MRGERGGDPDGALAPGTLPFVRWGGFVATVLAVAAGCGGGSADELGDAPEVERIAFDAPLSDSVVAIGDQLLAGAGDGTDARGEGSPRLLRSSDLGESWEPVSLPGSPSEMEIDSFGYPRVVEGLAVVGGRALVEPRGADPTAGQPPAGDAYIWTSRDGIEWRGGRVAGPGSDLASIGVDVAGGVLVAGLMTGTSELSDDVDQFELYRSDDDGGSWTRASVSGVELGPGETVELRDVRGLGDGRLVAPYGLWGPAPDSGLSGPSGPRVLESSDGGITWQPGLCPPEAVTADGECILPETAGSLMLRDGQVSVDGGQAWQDPTIDPVPGSDPPADLEGVVELPGGGWLASAVGYETGDQSWGFLLRSDDGLRWRQLLAPDPCHNGAIGRPNSSVSQPVRLGERWLVAYSCDELISPLWSQLYVLSAAGTNPVEVPDSRRDAITYSESLVVGDVVVVPETTEGGTIGVVLLGP